MKSVCSISISTKPVKLMTWWSGKAEYFLLARVLSTGGTSLPFLGSPRSVTTSRSPHGFSSRAGTHRRLSGHLRESCHPCPRPAIAGSRPACRDPCSQRRWRQKRRYSSPGFCALGRRLGRWERLRCWLSVLSPSSSSSSPCDGRESCLVSRWLDGWPRGVSDLPWPCLHGSCGGSNIRSPEDRSRWLYFPPLLLQLAEEQNLEIL